jgi:hypothetical protein
LAALPADRKGKANAMCAYGHAHTQNCDVGGVQREIVTWP